MTSTHYPSIYLSMTCILYPALTSKGDSIGSNLPSRSEILAIATLVNDHWIANHALDVAQWSSATYYTGNQRLYEITRNTTYLDWATDCGNVNSWLRSEKPWKYETRTESEKDAGNHSSELHLGSQVISIPTLHIPQIDAVSTTSQ